MRKKLLKLGAAIMIVVLTVGSVLISSAFFSSNTPPPVGECPEGEVPTCPMPDSKGGHEHLYQVYFPHPNDCHYFFHCKNGVAHCYMCPAGLHWNTVLDTCDYPYNAGCMPPQ